MSTEIAPAGGPSAPRETASQIAANAPDRPTAAPALGVDTARLNTTTASPRLLAAAYAPQTAAVQVAARPDGVAQMTTADKMKAALNGGIAIAARDAKDGALAALKDPKTVALVAGGATVAIGVQFIPVVGEAADVVAGVVGVGMYAAAGPEHRKEIGAALGELKAYFETAHDAKNQHDLDVAAGHMAKFLEKGGKEGADALLTLAGAVAAPAKFAKLLTEFKGLGKLSDVIALGERGATAFKAKFGALASRVGDLGGEALGLLRRGASAVEDAVKAAPGKVLEIGRALGHRADAAVAHVERFFGDLADHLLPHHAVTPEGVRVPVPRRAQEPPNVALSKMHDGDHGPVGGAGGTSGTPHNWATLRETAIARGEIPEFAHNGTRYTAQDKALIQKLGLDPGNGKPGSQSFRLEEGEAAWDTMRQYPQLKLERAKTNQLEFIDKVTGQDWDVWSPLSRTRDGKQLDMAKHLADPKTRESLIRHMLKGHVIFDYGRLDPADRAAVQKLVDATMSVADRAKHHVIIVRDK